MFRALQNIPIAFLLLAATVLEVSGDAIVRLAMYNHVGVIRVVMLLVGAVFLLGYGTFVNIAPVDFGRIAGLYIATLFVIWQIISFLVFRTAPPLPVWVGGALVIAGGAIITLWRAA